MQSVGFSALRLLVFEGGGITRSLSVLVRMLGLALLSLILVESRLFLRCVDAGDLHFGRVDCAEGLDTEAFRVEVGKRG